MDGIIYLLVSVSYGVFQKVILHLKPLLALLIDAVIENIFFTINRIWGAFPFGIPTQIFGCKILTGKVEKHQRAHLTLKVI